MKKIYSALALAMVVCASASAKTFDAANSPAQQLGSMELKSAEVTATAPADNGIKKVCNFKSVSDLYGYYRFSQLIGLTGHSGYETTTIEIAPSDKEGYVSIIGFFYSYPLEAKVDVVNQTLTVEKQEAFYSSYYKKQMYYYPATWNEAGDGIDFVDSVTLKYYPDGVEYNGETYYVGWMGYENFEDCITIPYIENGAVDGWFTISYGYLLEDIADYIAGTPVAEVTGGGVFEYNSSEWYSRGNATLTDGFLSPVFTTAPSAYSVPVKRNIANPNLILLVDPFGADTPYGQGDYKEYNTSYQKGYLMLDISNPECVKVVPFVYSGFSDEGWGLFFSNVAGYAYYLGGYDDEDTAAYVEMMGYDLPTMDDNYVINIYDGLYSTNYDILNYGDWTDEEDNVLASESVIQLPEDILGVEGVLDDTTSEAVRYYNLQGVEVASPVKGDLVIAKQGAKATKVLVK